MTTNVPAPDLRAQAEAAYPLTLDEVKTGNPHVYKARERAAFIAGAVSRDAEIAELRARIDQVLTLVQPIIDRTGNQIGTHALDGSCMEYHVGCLAVGIRARLTEKGGPASVTSEPFDCREFPGQGITHHREEDCTVPTPVTEKDQA